MTKSKRITTEELEAIRKRAEAATEGPWDNVDNTFVIEGDGMFMGDLVAKIETEADATFIAAAREDIPKLLAHIEFLSEQGKRQHEALNKARYYAKFWENTTMRHVEELADRNEEVERLRAEVERLSGTLSAFSEVRRRVTTLVEQAKKSVGETRDDED